MKKEEYQIVQEQLMTLGAIVADMPLAEFVNEASRAETVGPILDPTLYIKATENLSDIKRMAQALINFQNAVLEVRERHNGG